MPYQTPTACADCGKAFEGDGIYCPSCKENHKDARRAYDRKRFEHDEYHNWLNKSVWRKCSAAVKNQNVQCQVTENGQQCMNLSSETHHILSGRDYPALRLNWSNLVAVCGKHHPNADGDMDRYDYVPTRQQIFGIVTEFPHPSRKPVTQQPQDFGPPPESVPVAPEHADLPDGTVGRKWQWDREYRKQGALWMLIPA
jgi:hypothetical protein